MAVSSIEGQGDVHPGIHRVMFTGALSSSSARLGLLTVPSYKKFSVANAPVAFGDIKDFSNLLPLDLGLKL